MLRFVCERAIDGDAAAIKEYTVAVEALGRAADFNPKRDPIVRVEAHRLRKRLGEYYASEGAAHTIRIALEPGQYVPRFVAQTAPAPPPALPPAPPPAPPARSAVWRSSHTVAAGAALVLSLAVLPLVTNWVSRVRAASIRGDSVSGEIRLLAGVPTGTHVDPEGNFWSHDEYFRGGTAVASSAPALDFTRPAKFWSRRQGEFDYDIPLKPGAYQLRLFFGALHAAPADPGSFRVLANGVPIMDRLDRPVAPCDPAMPIERVFANLVPATDGRLHLHFDPVSGPAYVDAIEIAHQPGGRAIPIRLLAKASPYIDGAGVVWNADRHFCGGTLVNRHEPVVARGVDPNVFSGERFGAFSYLIPASPGRYRLTLRFSEFYFGPDRPGGGGPGDRIFDVFLGGRPLVRNLDVFTRAGGSLRPLDISFEHVEPDAAGEILLQFLPQKNNALINSIELVPET